jgi:hypothetical protein
MSTSLHRRPAPAQVYGDSSQSTTTFTAPRRGLGLLGGNGAARPTIAMLGLPGDRRRLCAGRRHEAPPYAALPRMNFSCPMSTCRIG